MTAWDYALWISLVAVAWLIGKGVGYFKGYRAGRADAAHTKLVLRHRRGRDIGSVGIVGFAIEAGTPIDIDGDH